MTDLSVLSVLLNGTQTTSQRDTSAAKNGRTQFGDALLRFAEKNAAQNKKKKDLPPAELAAMMQTPTPNNQSVAPNKDESENLSVLNDKDVADAQAPTQTPLEQLSQILDDLAAEAGYENLDDMLQNPRASDEEGVDELSLLTELIARLSLDSPQDIIAAARAVLGVDETQAGQMAEINDSDPETEAMIQALKRLLENETGSQQETEVRSALWRLSHLEEDSPPEVEMTTENDVVATLALDDVSGELDTQLLNGESETAAEGMPEDSDGDRVRTSSADAPVDHSFAAHLNREAPVVTEAPPPAESVQPHAVNQQIVQAVKLGQEQGVTSMKLLLNPEFLGPISIVLSMSSEGLKAHITAENGQAHSLLASQIQELTDRMKNAGIDMQSIEVTQSEINWDYSRGGQEQRNGEPQTPYQAPVRRALQMAALNTVLTPQTQVYEMAAVSASADLLDGGVEYFA